ncbi:TetR/AcrR family transcriptional regulator [Lichenibacterium dinghuense]|uniref:TetR/AcrR family transcriptional regulator n=1 Tax=Lichenibacterium dinghuense TaxID=2895977 RepID=UPI001F453C6D|nr:TetR family transcriptional regulator [Lichenibacterium sp. 6Y81]
MSLDVAEAAPPRAPSRQAEATRGALVAAGLEAFAEHGFEAASVRDITAKAAVNQGAITYHFGGKEGLYRAVLEAVRDKVSAQPLLDPAGVADHPPPELLRRYFRQMLAPLAEGPEDRRHLRVFAWEQLRPTPVGASLAAEKPFPPALLAGSIVRRLRPGLAEAEVAVAVAWMVGQAVTFLRDADYWARPPFGVQLDAASLDGIVAILSRLCLGGLAPAVHLTEI